LVIEGFDRNCAVRNTLSLLYILQNQQRAGIAFAGGYRYVPDRKNPEKAIPEQKKQEKEKTTNINVEQLNCDISMR
jgi:hypothetical protein